MGVGVRVCLGEKVAAEESTVNIDDEPPSACNDGRVAFAFVLDPLAASLCNRTLRRQVKRSVRASINAEREDDAALVFPGLLVE